MARRWAQPSAALGVATSAGAADLAVHELRAGRVLHRLLHRGQLLIGERAVDQSTVIEIPWHGVILLAVGGEPRPLRCDYYHTRMGPGQGEGVPARITWRSPVPTVP